MDHHCRPSLKKMSEKLWVRMYIYEIFLILIYSAAFLFMNETLTSAIIDLADSSICLNENCALFISTTTPFMFIPGDFEFKILNKKFNLY
jgi:hypothetical protein